MGDCRIRLVIAKELLPQDRQTALQTSEASAAQKDWTLSTITGTSVSLVKIFSADTTIREVTESAPDLWALCNTSTAASANTDFQLWDCTTHPPNDITEWPTRSFPDLIGPKSKTLHDAGCFPSGTWMVLPRGVTPSEFANTSYDDVQYNQPKQGGLTASVGGTVEFTDPSLGGNASSKPLPSQVMASVTQRFLEEDQEMAAQAEQSKAIRLANEWQQQKKRQERAAKLDRRIQLLEDQSSEKNKKVSDQVRSMLVKSRATGDKKLKQMDRRYFECLVDKNGDDDERAVEREFRFFSPQDSFAKIAASFHGPPKASVEVLVRRTIGAGAEASQEYRRFPNIMRVYEAVTAKFLTGDQVDTIVIRWFEGDDATPSILEEVEECSKSAPSTNTGGGGASADVEMMDAESPHSQVAPTVDSAASVDAFSRVVDDVTTDAIRAMDEAANNGKKVRKASAAATKVRNMQIKSKAKGDAKRIPKVEDRFFLEVVHIDRASGQASSGFHFLANKDPIERVVSSVAGSTKPIDWEFLVPLPDGDGTIYNKILDASTPLEAAAEKGILKSFDRLILRPK